MQNATRFPVGHKNWVLPQLALAEENDILSRLSVESVVTKETKSGSYTFLLTLQDKKSFDITLIEKEDGTVQSMCSCGQKDLCEHSALLAYHLIKTQNQDSGNKNLSNYVSHQLLAIREELSLQQEIMHKETDLYATIFFLIKPKRTHRLAFSIAQTKRKKNGELSAMKVRAFSIDEMPSWPEKLRDSLKADDWEILQKLWQLHSSSSLDPLETLQSLIATGRCFLEESIKKPLCWGEEKTSWFAWKYTENDEQTLQLESSIALDTYFLFAEKAVYVSQENCGPLRLPTTASIASQLLDLPAVSYKEIPLVHEKLQALLPSIKIQEIPVLALPKQEPVPFLRVRMERETRSASFVINVSFVYAKGIFPAHTWRTPPFSHHIKKHLIYRIERDTLAESCVMKVLFQEGFHESYSGNCLRKSISLRHEDDAVVAAKAFYEKFLVPKKKAGWIIKLENSFPVQDYKVHDLNDDKLWYVHAQETDQNWFDLELGSMIDGKRVNLIPVLKEFYQQAQEKGLSIEELPEKFLEEMLTIQLSEEERLIIPFRRLKTIFSALLGFFNTEQTGNKLRMAKWNAPALTDLSEQFAERLHWQLPKNYEQVRQTLKDIQKIEKVTPPQGLHCELRPYQIEGMSWLQFLRKSHLSGILADDMGLGKTIQTLAHILLEKESGRMEKPALIIAPTTLMRNWQQETARFAPSLRVLILQGDDRKSFFEQIPNHDIVLTTYPLLPRDQDILLKQKFYFLILDEAQNIKNANTQAHRVLRDIQSEHKFCLTGTPMENHLGELWSFFHILLPGFLGTEKQFAKWFRKPIEKEGSLERKRILQKRIHPFMLRRTKQEVEINLPPKTEIVTSIPLTQKQQNLYEAVRMTMMEKVFSEVAEKGLARSRIIVLDALLKLRQTCCDPRLLKTEEGKSSCLEDSSKLSYLQETLPQLLQEGRKILLFSQFTSMLSLVEELLKSLDIPYAIITGDTKDRITPIEEFQKGKKSLMLISLKAGGTGLNLTAADTVIMYDPWWNPAVENQAIDRAYRIGQTKPVFVYKLISSGSVEEKIAQLQIKKKAMADGLFDESNTTPLEMDLAELESLFKPLETS
ncbi:MAG: DEAD/DEAH box helicase [Chlamydiae bacterium]|nr:DEAD/DEAH box helicase [Chlamydiota bacterium]